MIRFGPAGNSEQFYEDGNKHTYQAMKWLSEMGLNAFEYSFGRGVRLSEPTAKKIRDEAQKYDIALSVHAPYFINLSSDDEEKFEKNIVYFSQSTRAAKMLGASRVIFHPGACAKLDRGQAFGWTKDNLKRMMGIMDEEKADVTYCPETMGKLNQMGDLSEVIAFCNIDERIIPTIDFAHLHARTFGGLTDSAHFAAILDELINGIGHERTAMMHIHFSTIEYTKAGEKRHMTFDDENYGPRFELLAPELVKRKLFPRIICESSGTMAKDALHMKTVYEAELNK